MLESLGKLPQHGFGVAAIDGAEQTLDAAADNSVIHVAPR